jgi:hypothetical protein
VPTLSPDRISDTEIPTLEWDDFLSGLNWYQGEHLTAIGPTKSGKTTLLRELLRNARRKGTHPYQVVIATKRKDEILDTFKTDRFAKVVDWGIVTPEVMPQVMLAPPLPSARDASVQREAIRNALTSIYRQGGWTVTLDELKHIAAYLSLEPEVELLLHQGRSAGITVVSGVQRPRHVPLMAYDQSTHLFLWESRDHNIRQRLSELGGRANPDLVMHGVSSLPDQHTFLYVNPTTGEVVRSKVDVG